VHIYSNPQPPYALPTAYSSSAAARVQRTPPTQPSYSSPELRAAAADSVQSSTLPFEFLEQQSAVAAGAQRSAEVAELQRALEAARDESSVWRSELEDERRREAESFSEVRHMQVVRNRFPPRLIVPKERWISAILTLLPPGQVLLLHERLNSLPAARRYAAQHAAGPSDEALDVRARAVSPADSHGGAIGAQNWANCGSVAYWASEGSLASGDIGASWADGASSGFGGYGAAGSRGETDAQRVGALAAAATSLADRAAAAAETHSCRSTGAR